MHAIMILDRSSQRSEGDVSDHIKYIYTFRRRPRCQAECNENEAKCTAGIWPLSVCNKNFSFGVRLWVASQKSRWCMALFRPLGAAHFWLTRVLAASAVPGH